MQPPSQYDAIKEPRSQAWGLARWTAKMDNNMVSALMRAVRGLLPHAEKILEDHSKAADEGNHEPSQEKVSVEDAISYAKAVLEVADSTSGPNLDILERMHGLNLPEWVYFSPLRASQGLPCYWSAAGEWVEFSRTTAVAVRAGIKVPPDGVWIPYKTASENTCYQAAARTVGGETQDHFVWAPNANLAREVLGRTLEGEYHVTILRAVA